MRRFAGERFDTSLHSTRFPSFSLAKNTCQRSISRVVSRRKRTSPATLLTMPVTPYPRAASAKRMRIASFSSTGTAVAESTPAIDASAATLHFLVTILIAYSFVTLDDTLHKRLHLDRERGGERHERVYAYAVDVFPALFQFLYCPNRHP